MGVNRGISGGRGRRKDRELFQTEGTACAKPSGNELVQVQRMVVRDEARESQGVEGRETH